MACVMPVPRRRIPVFPIPGNHEYFTGCVSFLNALDSDDLVTEPSQHQSASYFCLRTADDGWQLLGLDTGFYGHYMNVAASAQATLKKLHIGEVGTAGPSSGPHWPGHYNPSLPGDSWRNLACVDTTVSCDLLAVPAAEWVLPTH